MVSIIKVALKNGSKVVSFLKSAWGVISKYGSSGISWVKNHIAEIANVVSILDSVSDFINWIADQLKSYFGW